MSVQALPSIAASHYLGAHSRPFVPLPTPPLLITAEKYFRPLTRNATCPSHWAVLALRLRAVDAVAK